tara:strand:- start:8 stop:484 length:477 start_codon:yes stop_codon:yes gene_type:complete
VSKPKEETVAVQDAFIAAYGECGTVRTACTGAQVSRSTVYRWIDDNLYGFKDKYHAAQEVFKEYLQDLAVERVKGQGPKDNPVLLITMMNAFIPEKFRRDSQGADSISKEIMAELKRWRKESGKKVNTARSEEDDARKNAIDEVEKILSRKRESDDDR